MTASSTDSDRDATVPDPSDLAAQVDAAFPTADERCERAREQIRFAAALARHHDDTEWASLVTDAVSLIESERSATPDDLIGEVEQTLAPIGEVAQSYTVHYVGHAHIDMNWLWDYPETVHTTYRAFSTMFDIMDEYPGFRFTQSQVSTYEMMAEHAPEVFDEIGDRIDAGQWEVAANTWVQGDKNMATGESQARSLLYSQQFVDDELGAESTPVDFEPDTFGHPATVPKILQDASIDYYYLGRSGGDQQPDREHGLYDQVPQLFRWRSADGSEVVAFNGAQLWYNGHVDPEDVTAVLEFESETGMREFLDLYGVGNHGGGPTRADIETIQRMAEWPVFPETELSTLEAYFESVEAAGTDDLPVIEDELNFVFRGCYSSQSRAKQYNRRLESKLPTAEALSVIAALEADFEYPQSRLRDAWQTTLFNQFHDILPGAGVSEAYDHALGSYQEAEATADLVCDRALEALDDDLALYHEDADSDVYVDDGIPLLVFNPTGQSRTDHVRTLVYDYPEDWDVNDLIAVDADGNEHPVQVLETNEDVWDKIDSGEYAQNRLPDPSRLMHDANFGPNFARVGLTVPDIPAYGYEILSLREAKGSSGGGTTASGRDPVAPADGGGTTGESGNGVTVERGKDQVTLENGRYRVVADARRGAVTSLYDKIDDREFVPDEGLFGFLTVEQEVPHAMSAWIRDQVASVDRLDEGWRLEVREQGAGSAAVRWEREYRDSTLQVELRLPRDVPTIEWELDAHWCELGDDERGVPALRLHFPVDVPDPTFRYDVPYGVTEREADGMDVPASGWADLRDAETGTGLTVANDTTYGHSADDGVLSLTLLRSSYSPDTAPEVGRRQVACSLRPHGPGWTDADADHHGRQFARTPVVEQLAHGTGTTSLPRRREFVTADTDQVAVTALKQATDGDDIVARLQELAGEPCEATVSFAWPFDDAIETSLVETEAGEMIEPTDGAITLSLDPYEVRTIRLS